jgi:hypothetical protein
MIGFGVRIGDTYVNDTIIPPGLKAMDQHISLICAFVLVKIVVGLRTSCFTGSLARARRGSSSSNTSPKRARSCHMNTSSATIMD